MKRIHLAILAAEILSYGLIITFIFADMTFDLTSIFRSDSELLTPQMALVAACLVGLVGTINVWLTWYYMRKSNTMRDWLVICAWTHRVKQAGRWVSLEDFLSQHLGFQVSHGLSDPALVRMRDQLDERWQNIQLGNKPSSGAGDSRPAQT